jgi:hypothetical protein
MRAAKVSSTALVATSDLFKVAQYLSDHPDEHFAKQCRQAILQSIGVTKFPEPPAADQDIIQDTQE